jgi:hypothetical protein
MTTPISHRVALLGHLLLVINNFICSRCAIRKGIAHPFSLLIVVQQLFHRFLGASSMFLPAICPHFPLKRTPWHLEAHAFSHKLSSRVFRQAGTFPYHMSNTPQALKKAKLDNIALVPALLLLQKGKYQTIANNLPGQGVLICLAEKKERISRILEHVAAFFRQRGHFVRMLPYSLL